MSRKRKRVTVAVIGLLILVGAHQIFDLWEYQFLRELWPRFSTGGEPDRSEEESPMAVTMAKSGGGLAEIGDAFEPSQREGNDSDGTRSGMPPENGRQGSNGAAVSSSESVSQTTIFHLHSREILDGGDAADRDDEGLREAVRRVLESRNLEESVMVIDADAIRNDPAGFLIVASEVFDITDAVKDEFQRLKQGPKP